MPRELTLRPAEILHPQNLDGRAIWLDPEVQDLVDRLHLGDPTIGWEGDPRLAIYRGPGRTWELWRLENDGEYRMVCKSRPGLGLDNRLIVRLVQHDARRGFDPKKAVDANNAKVDKERNSAIHDKKLAAADKLRWALIKDVGHLY